MKIDRIDHLVVTTACLEACLHFYTGILNLEADNSDGRWAVKFGNQKLNIHCKKSEFLPAARNVTYGSQDLCLIAEGPIEVVKAEIEAAGWPIELGVVQRSGALGPMDSIYLRDPDENLIEIGVYSRRS